MKRIFLTCPFVLTLLVTACGGSVPLGGEVAKTSGSIEDELGVLPSGTQKTSSKVDLLLLVDDSPSMGDKEVLLRKSVPSLITRLVSPNCIDATGHVLGPSSGGACTSGQLEFAPVTDLHVGILSSSLGGRGSESCPGEFGDRGAHLLTTGADGSPVLDAEDGFLSFGPGKISDANRLEVDLANLVAGVGERGCGLEAQLESVYRFLIQPDPYAKVRRENGSAVYDGIDTTILKQRRDFLRPDSLVVVTVLSDENDASFDPRSIRGQGWALADRQFPGSTVSTGFATSATAPKATTVCATNPLDPSCNSCGFAGTCDTSDARCVALQSDPNCVVNAGYYPPAEDDFNLRFFRPKQRFGLDVLFPISRYAKGLSSAKVPNRDGEDPATFPTTFPAPNELGYVGNANCDNPLFSINLPIDAGADLCHLTPGPRARDLVLFNVIAGVPSQLVQGPLDESAWTALLGKNPSAYDFTGIDPHMLESTAERAGLPSSTSADDADPAHGREWNTQGKDLQYACTFPLEVPRVCTQADPACDCSTQTGSPLCANDTDWAIQKRGKAYPGTRLFEVAHALNGRSVVSSLCPTQAIETLVQDPLFAYRPAMNVLADRMARGLVK